MASITACVDFDSLRAATNTALRSGLVVSDMVLTFREWARACANVYMLTLRCLCQELCERARVVESDHLTRLGRQDSSRNNPFLWRDWGQGVSSCAGG